MFLAMGALTTVEGAVLVAVVVVAGVVVGVVFFVFFAVPFCARATATGENRRSRESRRIEAGKMCRVAAGKICRSKTVMYCITLILGLCVKKWDFQSESKMESDR